MKISLFSSVCVALLLSATPVLAEATETVGSRLTYVCKTLESAKKYATLRQEVSQTMDVTKFGNELSKLLQDGKCRTAENEAHYDYKTIETFETRFNSLIITKFGNGEFIVKEQIEIKAKETFDICTEESAAESLAKLYASDDDGVLENRDALPEFTSKVCRNVSSKVTLKVVRRSQYSDETIANTAYYEIGEVLIDENHQYVVVGTRFDFDF